ncbi:MAG TPA: glycine zipper family protein [Bryobacterales bacterium]|jgi:hypothetical protein|nr:glycine zipper family protein [Bryobacterales bacterium]
MKMLVCLPAALAVSSFLLAAPGPEQPEIPQGAHLLLRMVNSVNTRTAQEGDYVYLRTASPISVGGRIIVPVNSYVQGVVSHTRRSGRVAGRAELGIRLETLTLPSGRVVKFSPRLSSVDSNESEQKVDRQENFIKQGPDTGRDARSIAILAGTGASIGGIADRSWSGAGIGAGVGSAVGLATVLASRGREVELRQGRTLDVTFDRPVALE